MGVKDLDRVYGEGVLGSLGRGRDIEECGGMRRFCEQARERGRKERGIEEC